jgi:membrane-bound lytic murein transglycosylase B
VRFFAVVALLALTAMPALAKPTPQQWVQAFWPTAKAAGISRVTYNDALGNFQPDPDVIKRSQTQAEFKTHIWDYLDMMVSEERLSEGKEALARYGTTLARIEARYGVDRYIVAAVWGIESHYGHVLENPKLVRNTIRSLATLAYSGGRFAKFGRQQLVAALKIAEHGDISIGAMMGSWAGAMGQTQFIPTTYNAYAVDFDGDGHRNIWTSVPDALASTANYLKKSGWKAGHTWGYEVVLPAGLNTRKKVRTLGEWQKLGVTRAGGQDFPRPSDRATLFMPAGRNAPVFLLLGNFSVIKRYNNADSYALAVGHLADRLRGGGPFRVEWPGHEPPLSLDERKRVQQLLTAKGYYSGDIDGDIGSGSREAIRDFQLSAGVTPDGVGNRALLRQLEAAR